MELSESVTKGLQTLADPVLFDPKSFTIFTEIVFDSLVSSGGETFLGKMAMRSLCATLLPVLSAHKGSRTGYAKAVDAVIFYVWLGSFCVKAIESLLQSSLFSFSLSMPMQ